MDDLVTSLRALSGHNVQEVADVLQKHANEKAKVKEEKSYQDLVKQYHQSQKSSKNQLKSKPGSSSKSSSQYFSLNFAKFKQVLKGLKKETTNVQVVGFCETDSYHSVVSKAAQGLGIADFESSQLVCSGGVVPNVDIFGEEWTLGDYIRLNGGTSNRSKKVWGLLVSEDEDEDLQDLIGDLGGHSSKKPKKVRSASLLTKHSLASNSDGNLFQSKKRKILETCKECPIVLGSEPSAIEINPDQVVGMYCPLNFEGEVCTAVIGVGIVGVWRLINFDYVEPDKIVMEDALLQTQLQPENHRFYLVELYNGSDLLFKVMPHPEEFVDIKKVAFTNNVTKVTTTTSYQAVDDIRKHAALLVLSPNHGSVTYSWKRRTDVQTDWENIAVTPHTCLLYACKPGEYKCTVEDENFLFTVALTGHSNQDIERIKKTDLVFDAVIGSGSFAVVHRGRWRGMEVAIKSIKIPSGSLHASDLPKEVEILGKLKHPHIVSLMGYCYSDDEIILITNFVRGSNLDKLLFGKQDIQLTDKQGLDIATKIADAIHYMHSHNPIIIHQDLKPLNVLVTTNLQGIFVCDLGIAKMKIATEITKTSLTKGPGTIPYMAPEMFVKSHRGTPVDIYSFGCLLIELFGRNRVWPGLDGPGIMLCIMGSYQTPPQMPNISHLQDDIQELVSELCQLDPKDRPTSDQVLHKLRHLRDL